MKKYFTLFAILGLLSISSFAQQFKWLKGGGSKDNLLNGAIKHEFVKSICTDDNKNVYILATVGKNSIKADTFQKNAVNVFVTWRLLFASYDCNGKMRFAKLFESKQFDFANDVVYSKGKVYVAGVLVGDNKRIGDHASFNTQYQSAFVAKFDTSGAYNWITFVGADSPATVTGAVPMEAPLAMDAAGNIHYFLFMNTGVRLTSSIVTQAGNYDLKYDVNGNLLSAMRLPINDTIYRIRKAAIDLNNGNFYGLFSEPGGSGKPQTILAAFTPSAGLIWQDTSSPSTAIASFRLSSDGIYVVGTGNGTSKFNFSGLSSSNQYYPNGPYSCIMKLDYNGKGKWIHTVHGQYTNNYQDIEVLPNQQIAAYGLYNGKARSGSDSLSSALGGDFFPMLVIIDTNRTIISIQEITSSGSGTGEVIAKDKYGSMYLGGRVGLTMTPKGLSTYNINGGNSDFYLLKYGYDCNCTAMPTSGFTFKDDTLKPGKVTFTFTGTQPADSVKWDFGDMKGRSKLINPTYAYGVADTYTVCATVYTACGTHRVCKDVIVAKGSGIEKLAALEDVKVYPNPATDVLVIENNASAIASYKIMNMVGNKLLEGHLRAGSHNIDIRQIPSGMYVLEIVRDGQRQVMQWVKQ